MGTFTVGLVPHPTKSVRESIDILCAWKAAGVPGSVPHGGAAGVGGASGAGAGDGDGAGTGDADAAARKQVSLVARASDADRVSAGDGGRDSGVELVDEATFRNRVDVVVALGGDGTMLGAMRLVAGRPVPVLGVNYGNVGFLVEVEPAELTDALERMSEKQFSLEPHHAIEVVHTTSGSESRYLAFNDVSIARRPGEGVVTADLVVDETPYGYYKADAIIAATSAGSTAYNYAAGGPVLSPAVAATLITPVAPMSGIDRSVVLGPGEELRFQIGAGTQSAGLEVDGRVVADVSAGCVVSMRLRREAGQVIRFDAGRHQTKGRLKLSLLDLPLREDQLLELVPSDVRARFKARTAHKRPSLGLGPGPLAVPEGDPVVGLDARGDDVELDDQVVDGSTADGDATGALDEGAALDDMATRGGAAPDLEDASDPDDIDRASHAHVPS